MSRISKIAAGVIAMAALVIAAPTWADDDDKVMGNYEGAFTTKGWEEKSIRAQVIAQSKIHWKVNLFVADKDGEEAKGTFEAQLDRERVKIDAEVDLGGKHKITGQIAGEVMEAKLEGGKSAAFTLKRVHLQSPTLGAAPPEGAIVLFDGTNMAENWVRTAEQWCLTDESAMEVCSSNLKTRQEFGDAEYHIEFRVPFKPNARDQERGNSGVYVMGRYEVQVLDSFGEEPRDNWCGGIYKKAKPLLGASLPPLAWQTYDITFIAPKFDADGNKTADAEITCYLNGKLIHDKVKLSSPTPGGVSDLDAPTGPILLQDHDNPVRFRNIWVKPLNK